MKKKIVRASGKSKAQTARRHTDTREKKSFLILLKSWMFVVMFALMLGVGAIIGTYINQQVNANNPEVAGAAIETVQTR
jgi:hypothetical protein